MFLYCDNYATCNATYPRRDTPEQTEAGARAKGWHIFHGTTEGGKPHQAQLCPACVGRHRRPDRHMPLLQPGDQTLIQMEIDVTEPVDQ